MRAIVLLSIFAVLLKFIEATENRKRKCGNNEHLEKSPEFCPRDSCAKLNPDFKCPQLPAIPLPSGPDCVCDDGYLRNPDGICVKAKKCPRDQTCGVNEVYNENRTSCPGDSCRLILIKPNCVANQEPDPGCECRKGYLRNKYGQCVPRDMCPEAQKCPINEVYYLCGTFCPRTCSNRFLPPSPCKGECREDCDCAPGFYRHDNYTCVPANECSPPACISNSHYETCLGPCDTVCTGANCSEYCADGCACNEGYFKKNPVKCVKYSDYPKPVCTGMNEEPSYCKRNCPPQSCESPYTDYYCPEEDTEPGCVCTSGYLRNSTGQCIPSDECPPPNPCYGQYEIWGDNANCQPTCENRGKHMVCKASVEPGCVCQPGYIRDSSGVCIPEEKCDECPCDERWVDCKITICAPKTCDQLGFPIGCPSLAGPCEDPGCICKDGYLRNSANICIPQDQCPSCGGDFNATAGCSNYCGQSCSDYKDTEIACPEICQYNGCQCLKGYVYDESIQKCVEPEDCPASCPDPNAERVSCATHCPATCDKPEPDPCPYAACTQNGCQCKRGYVLNKLKGKCIKINQCRADKPCNSDPNAKIKECANPCPATCKRPDVRPCPIPCRDVGCECRPGYIRSTYPFGKCVKPCECKEN